MECSLTGKKFSFTESVDTPLGQYEFHAFAMNYYVNSKGLKNHIVAIENYFSKKGYDKNKGHRITADTIKTAGYILESVQRNYRAVKNQFKKSELIVERNKTKNDIFWCQSNNKYYQLTNKFMKLIVDCGMVYPVEPKNYYLAISKTGTIRLCYQNIIGSRIIAKITDW